MKSLTQLFNNDLEFNKIKDLANVKIGVFGLNKELQASFLSSLYQSKNKGILVITNNLYQAEKMFETLSTYEDNCLLFPMDEFITSEVMAISPDLKNERINTLNRLCENNRQIVVAHISSSLRFLPSKKLWENHIYHFSIGSKHDFNFLKQSLINIGYKKQSMVTMPGEYATRGDIIDIYPIGLDYPVRIEFWDDEVESIRLFDPQNQLTIEKIDNIKITPYCETIYEDLESGINKLRLQASENILIEQEIEEILNFNNLDKYHKYISIFNNEVASLKDYLGDCIVAYLEYPTIKNTYLSLEEEIFNYKVDLLEEKKTFKDLNYLHDISVIDNNDEIYISNLHTYLQDIKLDNLINYTSKEVELFYNDIDHINNFINTKLNNEYTIILSFKSKNHAQKALDFINAKASLISNISEIINNRVNLIVSDLDAGYEWIDHRLIVLTEKELFNVKNKKIRYRNTYKFAEKIKNYKNLEIGDYVVHEAHGIGRYVGVVTLEQKGMLKDFLHIQYKGTDKLYIPVEQIGLIQKYSGGENAKPKLHKLGGTEWEKTKLGIKNRINDLAKRLIRIYAERELKIGYAYKEDTAEQLMFEQNFSYNETPDQLRATAEIKKDMEKPSPMDRLLCGDVGYGKTEVAFRAAFKAIMDGKQVAYLCPTTILSNQHFESARIRFGDFPINIALLNRFTPGKKEKDILEKVKTGGVDFLIGTHRILSNDIKFKDIGLLIIDEEQRFGVEHKEKLKELKASIDVLTLSATPIPRTLQMSMVGIRSLSLLETPPSNRYPIQTYVIEENEIVIKDAIERELARGGQIFILHNRTSDITKRVHRISKLVKEARITYAHGQMPKHELEERMLEFINHEYDVLVSTTIIETGIDIPNANTLIILDADKFGLSQLYQIRGRVGRSDRIAYAYLMYAKQKVLSEIATKRLQVIKEFTELGSGFKIAMRDLGIRGAGDILGSEQAGFIDSIGIEMYTKMLNDAVMRLQGIYEKEESYQKGPKNMIEVPTHINDNYVHDEDIKIEMHQKINDITSYEDLLTIEKEFSDRFGRIPTDLHLNIYTNYFEYLSKSLGITNLSEYKTYVSFELSKEISSKINGEKLFMKATEISRFIRFNYKNERINIIIDTVKLDDHYVFLATKILQYILDTYK